MAESSNLKCCICAQKNITEAADKYCLGCKDCFCLPCTDLHRMFPSMREHKLLEAELTTMRCVLHRTNLLNKYCGNHDQVACDSCVLVNHSTCQTIHNIAEEIDELYRKYKKSSLEDINRQLTSATKETKEQLIGALKNHKKRAIDSVRALTKELEAVLENESIKDIEAGYKKDEQKLLRKVEKADSTIKIFFEHFMEVGKVLPLCLYKIAKQKDVNVKLSNETNVCDIWGSCITENGSLLLVDCKHKKLKRVEFFSLPVKDHLDLVAQPAAVCQTSTTEAAISLHNNTIQFVSLVNKLTATRNLTLDHDCWGIACKDDTLFISDCYATVYIHDMNGRMINKVTTDQSGNAIFKFTRHISLSSSGDMVYVADYIKGLITLDIKGKYVSTFNDPDLVGSWGVCTDRRGNAFACGSENSKIIQINEESKTKVGMIGKVEDGGTSVCFYPKQNRLVVTVANRNRIKVHDLE